MKWICAIAVAGILAGTATGSRAEVADGIKAVVHDSIVTYQQVADYTSPFVDQLRSRYADQPDLFEKELGELEETNLEQLLERQLILHDFETSAFTNALPDSIIDREVQSYIRSNFGETGCGSSKPSRPKAKPSSSSEKNFARESSSSKCASPTTKPAPSSPRTRSKCIMSITMTSS